MGFRTRPGWLVTTAIATEASWKKAVPLASAPAVQFSGTVIWQAALASLMVLEPAGAVWADAPAAARKSKKAAMVFLMARSVAPGEAGHKGLPLRLPWTSGVRYRELLLGGTHPIPYLHRSGTGVRRRRGAAIDIHHDGFAQLFIVPAENLARIGIANRFARAPELQMVAGFHAL